MSEAATISIIIPVLHEEAALNRLIDHIRRLPADRSPEIIVVDGDPSGSTIRTVRQDGPIASVSAAGRAHQMNRGASLASGDVLLFLHADTLLPENAFADIRTCLEDERFVGGAFALGIASDRRIFRITEKYVALRTRITRVPFGDQAIFLRREYFERMGGYRSMPLMEDVELMVRVRRHGDRICILPAKVMTSARRWEMEGIFVGTFRNWMLQVLYLFGVPPERLAQYYHTSATGTKETDSLTEDP
jgi:rSAM/selenodomain-associated transferase 2